MLCLHRKSAQKLVFSLMLTQIFQNIIGPLHLNRKFSVRFLYFLVTDRFRPVIGDCCRLDHDILLVKPAGHCLIHIPCRSDRYYIHKKRRLYRRFSTDQSHICTTHTAYFCDRITHLSAGMIRQIPHRIDRLLRRSRGHKDIFAFQIFFVSHFP